MQGLMIHCGGKTVDETELRQAPTPEANGSHFPIPHGVLLDRTLELIKEHGLEVRGGAHALHTPVKGPHEGLEGARYFGMLEVGAGGDGGSVTDGTGLAPDYNTVIGLRNSHDKTFSAGLVVGSRVFVCDNLAFSGEVTMARKHSRNILADLPGLLSAAMGKLIEVRGFQAERIEAYKHTGIESRDAHDLILRGFRQKIVPATKIGKVMDEWEKPSHEDFEPRTVWSLFNAFTEVLKTRGQIFDKPRYTMALHGLMDGAAKVSPMKAIEGVTVAA